MLAEIILSAALLAPPIEERFVHTLIAQGSFPQALTILERARRTPSVLNDLGGVYYELGRLRDAQQAFEQAAGLQRQRGEASTHQLAITLNNLGMLYTKLNLLHQAEETIGQAVAIHRRYGDRIGEAQSLSNLGSNYRAEHRLNEAAALFRESLELREKILDPRDREIAIAANNLAVVLQDQKRLTEAEPLILRALSIWQTVSPKHPMVAAALNNLGVLYTALNRYEEAEPRLSRAIAIATEVLPPDHPNLASYRNSYAFLLRRLDRKKEAKQLEAAARQSLRRFDRDNALGFTVDARQTFH